LTEFNDLMKMLNPQDLAEVPNIPTIPNEESINDFVPNLPIEGQLFDIERFTQEIYNKSNIKNKLYRENSSNINAYDIASCCIREVVLKLNNTPVESFADKWLPIMMRSTIGNAIHEFIQTNSKQFTEREVSLKLPSIRMSVRLDNLIGTNILIEIKSCTYSDYHKIVTSKKPRISDFYQAVTYKYLLENHLQEAKDPSIKIREGTSKPKFDKYDIHTIQFIYVAHDMLATDVESFSDNIRRIKDIKQLLHSKSNTFFFITTLATDVTNGVAKPYIAFIKSKLEKINYYLDNKLIPDDNDPYIDKSKCFFCLYKKLCNNI